MMSFYRMMAGPMAILLLPGLALAQQRPSGSSAQITPLKVEVVLSEYDGTKKISSLPYTITANAVPAGDPHVDPTDLRMGVRVPVVEGAIVGALPSPSNPSPKVTPSVQYMNVGTDIDCTARTSSDNRYQLRITVTRDSVYQATEAKELTPLQASTGNPVIRTFMVTNTLLLRDGQTDESTIASDPVTGHLLRVTVTLHVEKNP